MGFQQQVDFSDGRFIIFDGGNDFELHRSNLIQCHEGRSSCGSCCRVFSGLSTSSEEDFNFTILNMTKITLRITKFKKAVYLYYQTAEVTGG